MAILTDIIIMAIMLTGCMVTEGRLISITTKNKVKVKVKVEKKATTMLI
jgi:hypothetical protein